MWYNPRIAEKEQLLKYKDETRSVAEFRADDNSASISGHAASFLTVDSYLSTFGRSAFRKTLQERGDKVPLLFNHDSDKVIGKTTELRSDSKGLRFKADISEKTTLGSDIMVLIRDEVLNGMSFGFNAIKDRSGAQSDNIDLTTAPKGTRAEDVRFIEEVRLRELTVATFPSNLRPTITSYRSEDAEELLEDVLATIRSAELTPEQIERISTEIRSLASTNDSEEPPSTLDDEVRRQKESDDILIELAIIELGRT